LTLAFYVRILAFALMSTYSSYEVRVKSRAAFVH
jgi:hypothetical protein